MTRKPETNSTQPLILRDRWWVKFLLIFPVLALMLPNLTRKNLFKETSPSKPIVCDDAVNASLEHRPNVSMYSYPDCWSGAVYVPSGERFNVKPESGPAEAEVCFWVNNQCAAVKTIRSGDNWDWKADLPRDSTLRFKSHPAGWVKIQLVK